MFVEDNVCLSFSKMNYLISNLGISSERLSKASMTIMRDSKDANFYYTIETRLLEYTYIKDADRQKSFPSFTLEDILNMFPSFVISTSTGGYTITVNTKDTLEKVTYKNLLGAAYIMLCRLLRENKLLLYS